MPSLCVLCLLAETMLQAQKVAVTPGSTDNTLLRAGFAFAGSFLGNSGTNNIMALEAPKETSQKAPKRQTRRKRKAAVSTAHGCSWPASAPALMAPACVCADSAKLALPFIGLWKACDNSCELSQPCAWHRFLGLQTG